MFCIMAKCFAKTKKPIVDVNILLEFHRGCVLLQWAFRHSYEFERWYLHG